MLTIRNAQLVTLDEARLCKTAREQAANVGVDARQAEALAVRMARAHGLVANSDVQELIRLAITLDDFEFDGRPENEWMHARLRDPAISSVSRRLSWVLGEVQRRQSVARHNAAIEASVGHLIRR